jgi:predicted MFS family arabinose efflux permease
MSTAKTKTDTWGDGAREPQRAVRIVAPGLALIAVTYGLARFAYGLFLPQLRETFALDSVALGMIGAGSYLGYCLAVAVALVLAARTGPRAMAVIAAAIAVAGMALVAVAPVGWVLAVGVLLAGASGAVASPPMGDAVATAVRTPLHDRANAAINSGTSVGVVLSMPAALLAADDWRVAWAAFAVLGIVVLIWNATAMPSAAAPPEQTPPRLSMRYLVEPRSLPLFAVAAGIGFASAAYWTFSRELVLQEGELSQTESTLFWATIGAAGLAGGAAGDLTARLGLSRALRVGLLTMAAATALLAAVPGTLLGAYVSAALFGAAYIALTGIVLVWSVAVFSDRPSAGLGAAFLLIAAGQAAGAPIAGTIAGATTLATTFIVFASVAVATTLVTPRRRGG